VAYYTASGIPGTGGQNSPAALRYEFSMIQAAFGAVETTPITPAMIAGVSIPAVQITGQMTNAQIADLAAAKITGQITGAQIASGAISGTQFASTITPITVLSSVPGSLATPLIYNVVDGRVYRWADTAYVNTNAAAQIVGQLVAGQITAGAIGTDQLAANSVTAGQLAANSVTAVAIQAGSVTTAKLAANSVTANELAANSVVAGDIQAGAVTTDTMTANSINGDRITTNTLNANRIVANSISAAQIAANTITGDQLQVNSIQGDRILTGSLAADRIAANSITAGQLSATTFSADNIITRSMTIRTPSGDVILDPTTLLQPAYAATGLRNDNVQVNGSGQLVNIGSGAGTVVNNNFITINGSGQLAGIGTSGVVVNNNFINLSGGSGTVQLNGGGGGSATGIVMPGNPIGPANRGTYLQANVIDTGLILADAIVTDKITVGAIGSQAGTTFGSVAMPTGGGTSSLFQPAGDVSLAGARALSGANVFVSATGYVDCTWKSSISAGTIIFYVSVELGVQGFGFVWGLVTGYVATQNDRRPVDIYPSEVVRVPFSLSGSAYASPGSYSLVRPAINVNVRTEYLTLSDYVQMLTVNFSATVDARRV
jgi:hypothetical protein